MARVEYVPPLQNLLILIKDGSIPDLKIFLETHDRIDKDLKWDGLSALGYAVSKRKVNVVKLLLNFGVDVNVRGDGYEYGLRPFHYLYVKESDPEETHHWRSQLITYRKQLTKKALIIADLLVKAGANLNVYAKVYPPLIFAAKNNDISFATFLLDNGVDVDYTKDKLDTPVFYAAKKGNTDMVKLLLSKRAELNPKKGRLPLIGCSNNLEMTELLLSHGASPNCIQNKYPNKPQDTPILHALMHGNTKCIKAMLKYKIKPSTYPHTPGGMLEKLSEVSSLSFGIMRSLVIISNNCPKYTKEFRELAVILGSRKPQQYRLFPAFLDAGMDLLKCENIEKILYTLFRNTILRPSEVNTGSLQMIYLLTKHGVRISDHEEYLDQLQGPDITEKHLELYVWMCNCSNSPLTLQDMCRLRVRQQCSNTISPSQGMRTVVEQLNLPVTVKNYLQFDEIWDEMKKYWNFCRLCESISPVSNSICKCQKVKTVTDNTRSNTASRFYCSDDSDRDIYSSTTIEYVSDSENLQETSEDETDNDDLHIETDEQILFKHVVDYRYGVVV